MKTTKKLLLALVTLLVLSSVTMAVVFANEPAVGSLTEAGALMGKINSATTAADKVAAIEAFDAYMAEHTFDLSKPIDELNYSIIVETANAAKLNITEDNIALVKESASYQAMLNSDLNVQVVYLFELEGLLNNSYFDKSTEVYKTFVKECEALMAPAYAEYNARIATYYNAPFGEYELAVVKNLTFEPNDKGTIDQLSGIKTGPGMVYEYKQDGLGAQA